MGLVLEIEFLAGFCAAATGPDNETADWPPAADRVFSALVASWAARGGEEGEAQALRWLERQPPPAVVASVASARTTPVFYVPPNDARLDRAKTAKGVFPALRTRQLRRFAVARPEEPLVELRWPEVPETPILEALDRLAADTSCLGASRSLVRCRFRADGGPGGAARPTARWVYPGRLDELRAAYEARLRPTPGAPVRAAVVGARTEPSRASIFDERWLVLEHRDGTMPDLRACALVARRIRDCLMSGYRRLGLPVPETVSGHAADGSPTRAPHLAIVPLAFVGFPHADGRVMGFALVPPRESGLLDDETFRRVLRKLAPIVDVRGTSGEVVRELTVCTPVGTAAEAAFKLTFQPRFEGSGRRSLDPGLYFGPARRFATVTPIVLDRHLRERGAARIDEIRAMIESACERIGLPRPTAIVPDRHAALEGAPSIRIEGAPAWMRWRLPAELASRQLTHAVLEFAEPVRGPVLLGAGRFCGLGLCRALP
ncbi:MAG: type I-U CRISPR-associated protein Cas5/Cas6 [Geminicoccaceae bacterium]|nr:type I-U CRISPR-associated protein Cas5/Cas6 [Geminicoccaceae bacterium]